MDTFEDLANKASQLTMYDLKSYVTKVSNMVLNVSEMEAKVKEATNDDPWGASSTLMQEIAQGTHNYQHFNEILSTIWTRFMEKEAREWRQIYKALTLLEYLIKHGSERVVDDARAHVSTIKMLRSFHYIDEKGKDQGINVRNRAKEIAELLSDVERIRQERRKAKQNKQKYQGSEGGAGAGSMSFRNPNGGRYGGFGSESLGGAGYGDRSGGAGAGGGSGHGGRAEYDGGDLYRGERRGGSGSGSQSRAEYDEYEYDEADNVPAARSKKPAIPAKPEAKSAPPLPKQPEVDLFSWDDEEDVSATAAAAPAPATASLDDEFDDFQAFQAAPSVPAPAAAPAASSTFGDMFQSIPTTKATPSFGAPPMTSPPLMGGGGIPAFHSSGMMGGSNAMPPSYGGQPSLAPKPAAKPAAASSGFDDLWQLAGGSTAKSPAGGSKTIAQLDKEKTAGALWQSSSSGSAPKPSATSSSSSAFGDLLG